MVYRLCHHHPEAFWALNDNTCVHRVRLAAAAKDVGDVLDSNRHGPAHTRNDAIRADRALNSNEKLYLQGWTMTSDGAVWTTGTNVSIQSSDGAVTFATVTQANLPTNSAAVGTNLGTLTVGQGMALGTPAGKGLKFVRSGDFAGTPIITLHVWGIVRPVSSESYS